MAAGVSVLTQRFVERLTVRTVHVRFGHEWKAHVVLRSGKVADFCVRARLLRAKLIARETNHGQVVVCFVK